MGLFSDIKDFLFFGWLTPDLPKAEVGIDVTVANTDAYIPVAYGRCYGEGLLAYQATNDADNDDIKNDLLHRLVIWSEGECGGIIGHYADDEISTSSRFDAEDGGRWLQFADFNNGMGSYLDPHLAASGKRATDTFDSKQISYIRCEMTPGDVWSGPPTHMAEYRGRLISTPSGGTKTSSENPVDQLYDLLRSPVYGKGLTTNYIDVASFQSERQVCATQVETFAGSGVYRSLFTSNIILDTSNTVLDNVNTLLKAMRGWLFHSDGKLKLLIEKDDPPVDFVLDESDRGFIEWGNVTNSSKSNRYNRVICRYTDPDAGWTTQEVVYPEAGSDEEAKLLAEDNGVLLEKSITLDTCIYYHEAAQHAKTILLVSREQLRTSVEWGPEAVILEVGDIVPVMRNALGWDGKLFRIESTEKSTSTGRVELKLREHQPYIYDDANVGDKPVLPDTNLIYDKPQTPTNLSVTNVHDDFTQILLAWDSATSDHRIVLCNSDGSQILNTAFAGKSYSFNDLKLGEYTYKLYAVGGLGRSSLPAQGSFSVLLQSIEVGVTRVTVLPGSIIVSFPALSNAIAEYQAVYSIFNNANPNINDFNDDVLFSPVQSGSEITIPSTSENATYYIWHRVKAKDFVGDWVLVTPQPIGKGIGAQQLSPSVIEEAFAAFEGIDTTAIESQLDELTTSQILDTIDRANTVIDKSKQNVENVNVSQRTTIVESSLADPATGLSAAHFQISQVAQDSAGNSSAIESLEISVNNQSTGLNSTIQRVSQVEIVADDNVSAIDAIVGIVEDPASGLSATFNKANQAEIISGQNATALVFQQAQVENLDQGLVASTLIAQQAKITADGTASSLASIRSDVRDAEREASSALDLASDLDNDLDELKAVAILSVNAAGRTSLIQLGASPSQSFIRFETGEFIIEDEEGDPVLYLDSGTRKLTFDGTIFAANIEGDITDGAMADVSAHTVEITESQPYTQLATLTIPSGPVDRLMTFKPFVVDANGSQCAAWIETAGTQVQVASADTGSLQDGNVYIGEMSWLQPKNNAQVYNVFARKLNAAGTVHATRFLTKFVLHSLSISSTIKLDSKH